MHQSASWDVLSPYQAIKAMNLRRIAYGVIAVMITIYLLELVESAYLFY
jgi:hypothetical protein